jgi:phosphatidylserine decarboxylase
MCTHTPLTSLIKASSASYIKHTTRHLVDVNTISPAMSSLHGTNITESSKPVEVVHPDNLPASTQDPEATAAILEKLVDHSTEHDDVQQGIHAPFHRIMHLPIVQKLVPGIEDFANSYHVGNYVQIRGSDEKFFESMPIYPRCALYHNRKQSNERCAAVVGWVCICCSTEGHRLSSCTTNPWKMFLRTYRFAYVGIVVMLLVSLIPLQKQQGKNYDSPESIKNIPSFINTYGIQTDELAQPDITKYACFNDFFSRKLKDGARPVQNEEDPKQVCSAADCRLTVFESVALAKQFW